MNTSSGPDLPNPPLGDDSMGGESFHGRGVVPWARDPSMGGGSFHGQGVVSGAGVVSVAGGRQERPRVSKIAQEWPSGEGLEFSVFGRSKMNISYITFV